MRRAANLIERWQRFLTAEQVEEISNHLEGHQAVIDLVAPLVAEGSHGAYMR